MQQLWHTSEILLGGLREDAPSLPGGGRLGSRVCHGRVVLDPGHNPSKFKFVMFIPPYHDPYV